MPSNFTLHLGDCLETLRAMPDNSVDSIVTDPPYGLSFMGKKWDYDVPSVEIWSECLRVLKPGGHLLSFAGTRTQHRMAVRIEDAGFEIRDMIAWVYGAGFPKSHNLDNHRGDKICGCAEPNTQNEAKQKTECDVRNMRNSNVSQTKLAGAGCGQVLQHSVPEQGAHGAMLWTEPKKGCDGVEQWSMERRGDAPQAARELCAGEVCSSPGVGRCDDPQGRLRYGASSGDGSVVRLSADADGVRASCGPCATEQRERQSGAVAGQSEPQALGAWPVCGGCGLPVVPRGLGTALKPALEPITVARKPLGKGMTVAANVLAHGTGAINVNGCRVGDELVEHGRFGRGECESASFGKKLMGTDAQQWQAGRWPANLIHDGSDEVVACFPAKAGASAPVKGTESSAPAKNAYGEYGRVPGAFHGDTGSAARFFYSAKVSKSERNEGMPDGKTNIHPTLKPVSLMAYLCRLVTPPGGTVLDPFMGSGSTGKAAVREGFNFIGCELSAEYLEIARARIEHERAKVAAASEAKSPEAQPDMFAA